MSRIKTTLKTIVPAVLATIISACGGGNGGNNDAPTQPETPNTDAPVTDTPIDPSPTQPITTPAEFVSNCPPLTRFSQLGGPAGFSFQSFADTGVSIDLLGDARITGDLFECNSLTYFVNNALLTITGDFGFETEMVVAGDDITGRLLVLDEGGANSKIVLENLGDLNEQIGVNLPAIDESIITIRHIVESSEDPDVGVYEARRIFANLVGSKNTLKAVEADLGEVNDGVYIEVVKLNLADFINASFVRAKNDVDACDAWAQPGARVISDTGTVCFNRVFGGAAIEGIRAIVENADSGAVVVGAERVDIIGTNPKYSCQADIRGGSDGSEVYFGGKKLERSSDGYLEGCTFDPRTKPLLKEFGITADEPTPAPTPKTTEPNTSPLQRGITLIAA